MGRIVEIGGLREPVEILDDPSPGRDGRIKHANGENASIDLATFQQLRARALAARLDALGPAHSRPVTMEF